MKNIETPDKKHLSGIIQWLKDGSFVIPDFQREFEWEPWDIVDLIKSIFKDYYIGTLLLWKAGKGNLDVLKCERIYGYNGTEKPQHIVLDGQQRLTALYYAIFSPDKVFPRRKSKCYFLVRINKLLEKDYDEAFYYEWESNKINELISNPELQFKKKILPLTITKDPWEIIRWTKGYKKYWDDNNGNSDLIDLEAESIEGMFKDLLDNYYISYIELDRDIPIPKVCDIFAKINSKGVPLNIFDLLNALLRPHDIYLKQMWRDSSEQLKYTDPKKMKIYVLQVMSILNQTYCSPSYLYYLVPEAKKTIKKEDDSKEDIVLIKNQEQFISEWNKAIRSIKNSIVSLQNPRDFGAILPKFVPYPSIIPVLSAIMRYVDESNLPDKLSVNQKIKKWYWASIFTKNYSSSVETQSAKDFTDLKKWFRDDTAVPGIFTQFKNEYKNYDLESENKKGTAVYNAILNLLV